MSNTRGPLGWFGPLYFTYNAPIFQNTVKLGRFHFRLPFLSCERASLGFVHFLWIGLCEQTRARVYSLGSLLQLYVTNTVSTFSVLLIVLRRGFAMQPKLASCSASPASPCSSLPASLCLPLRTSQCSSQCSRIRS